MTSTLLGASLVEQVATVLAPSGLQAASAVSAAYAFRLNSFAVFAYRGFIAGCNSLEYTLRSDRPETWHYKFLLYLIKSQTAINVSGMIANHKLSAAISDLGFYEFRRQLEYKSVFYGGWLTVVDRWYPSSKTCAKCRHVQSMLLSERVFKCGNPECNWEKDRDLNAAINLIYAPLEQRKNLVYGWLVRNYA